MGVTKNEEVCERTRQGDGWYTDAHFEYSYGPARYVHTLRERFLRRCVEMVRPRVQECPLQIVEVGCGDGVNLYRLRDLENCELTGLDYNELRLERAREAVTGVRFEHCNLAEKPDCPVAGGAHMLIFSHVIEHIPDDIGVLRHLRGWLAPGGIMALLTPNEGCLLSRLRNHLFDRWISRETDHVHFYTGHTIRRLVHDAGLRVLAKQGEVLTFPKYRFHMALLRRRWGFRLLRAAGFLVPGQTSGWQLALEVATP